MNRQTRTSLIAAILIGLFLVSGCIPVTQKEMTAKAPMPSMDLVSPRMLKIKIADLNKLLTSDLLDERQREVASRLLETYKKIQLDIQGHRGEADCAATIETLLGFLTHMDETLLKSAKKESGLDQQIIHRYFQRRTTLFDDYLYGNYQGVVDKAIELKDSFGVDALTPEIGLLFASSLAKRGMLEEALNVSERIMRELEGRPDLIRWPIWSSGNWDWETETRPFRSKKDYWTTLMKERRC